MNTHHEDEARETEILNLMKEYGLTRSQATFAVALANGERRRDIVGFTDAERERLGLGPSLLDLESAVSAPTRSVHGGG